MPRSAEASAAAAPGESLARHFLPMPLRILAIDDDPETTRSLRRLLEATGHNVMEVNDPTLALATAREFQPHVVIPRLPHAENARGDVAWQLASDPLLRQTRMVVCSGCLTAEFSSKLPPVRIPVIEKPVDSDALLKVLRECTDPST